MAITKDRKSQIIDKFRREPVWPGQIDSQQSGPVGWVSKPPRLRAAMMEGGRVPRLSSVIVWVVYPPHPFKSGTNYYPYTEIRDQLLGVTWRPGAADTVSALQR